MQILRDLDGHARIAIDTDQISVSEAISRISGAVDVKDISVTGQTIDELVVSLYQEFAI